MQVLVFLSVKKVRGVNRKIEMELGEVGEKT